MRRSSIFASVRGESASQGGSCTTISTSRTWGTGERPSGRFILSRRLRSGTPGGKSGKGSLLDEDKPEPNQVPWRATGATTDDWTLAGYSSPLLPARLRVVSLREGPRMGLVAALIRWASTSRRGALGGHRGVPRTRRMSSGGGGSGPAAEASAVEARG